MKRIFAWQTDTAGCWLYRLYWPLTTLAKGEKFQVSWGAPGPDIFDYDIVIGQRISGYNELWLKLCADPDVMTVYDLDDDLLHVDPENMPIHAIYASQAEATAENIARADKVTVSTPMLAELLGEILRTRRWTEASILPNCLPWSWMQYQQPPQQLTVGWAGSMFHQHDWLATDVVGTLEQFSRDHPDAGFHLMGADYSQRRLPNLRYTPWSTMEAYHLRLDFSFGLVVLMRSVFNAMKSHCKVLEYASKGIPAIAPATGQYQDFIEHGVNGLLLHSSDQDTLRDQMEMLTNRNTLAAMGTQAHLTALNYTIERNIHLWESVYES